jgi:hypothetical protein
VNAALYFAEVLLGAPLFDFFGGLEELERLELTLAFFLRSSYSFSVPKGSDRKLSYKSYLSIVQKE